MVRGFARSTFFVTAGLLIWAADFLFTYVFSAVATARGFDDVRVLGLPIVAFVGIVATIVALVSTAAMLRIGLRGYREADRSSDREIESFVFYLAAAVAGLALLAILWNGFSVWLP